VALELTAPQVDIAIVCSDFAESRDFYQHKLGLEVAFDLQIGSDLAVPSGLAPGPFRHLRLRAGHTLIKLMEIDPPPGPAPVGFHAGTRWLTFFISDLRGTMRELSAQGVRFLSEPVHGLAGWFACAQAPDGVILEFVELFAADRA
jgi:catechol 2,3-dioxygenase-like lactoylglutathione lyase family enzyme